jgi:hypothetical protein
MIAPNPRGRQGGAAAEHGLVSCIGGPGADQGAGRRGGRPAARRSDSMRSLSINSPEPMPGQSAAWRAQSSGPATLPGQKGQVRHWSGRCSYTAHPLPGSNMSQHPSGVSHRLSSPKTRRVCRARNLATGIPSRAAIAAASSSSSQTYPGAPVQHAPQRRHVKRSPAAYQGGALTPDAPLDPTGVRRSPWPSSAPRRCPARSGPLSRADGQTCSSSRNTR